MKAFARIFFFAVLLTFSFMSNKTFYNFSYTVLCRMLFDKIVHFFVRHFVCLCVHTLSLLYMLDKVLKHYKRTCTRTSESQAKSVCLTTERPICKMRRTFTCTLLTFRKYLPSTGGVMTNDPTRRSSFS